MKHRLICLHNGAPHAIADEKQEDPLVLRNFIQGHLASRLMSRGDLRFPIWFFWLYDDPKELERYIINIYKTLLTRGIRGTYVYIVDKGLRDYIKSKLL